jgi:hypothetical protein
MPATKSATRIELDFARFRQTWLDFAKHPASARLRDQMTTSFGMCLFIWIFLFCIAMFMIITIWHAIDGFKGLWSLLKLEPFEALHDNPTEKPDKNQTRNNFGFLGL